MAPSSWSSSSPAPQSAAKYRWVKRALLERIDGELSPGDLVPSERELAEHFGVSRMTARRALDELVREGRVFREVGRGSFVAAPTILLPLQMTSFTVDMETRGLRPGARTTSRDVVRADDHLSRVLAIRPDEPVYRFVRLRTADGIPMAIERSHFPARSVPGLIDADLQDRSMYSIIATDYNIVFDGGEETIRARTATRDEAHQLGIRVGDAVLYLARISHWHGRPLEYTVSSYRGDRYELSSRIGSPA